MSRQRRVMVIGRSGQLARELAVSDWPSLTTLRFFGRSDLDLFNPARLCREIAVFAPDVIINAAGYTAVDKAEQEPEEAYLMNSVAVGHLALAAALIGKPIIHLSTDYVFDGSKEFAYIENDRIAPASIYGKSKAAGEFAVIAAGGPHVIVRSSWFFGQYGNNFLKTMLRLGRERPSLGVVNDQFGCPTPVAALATALRQIAVGITDGQVFPSIIHYAGDHPVTWFDFAAAIFEVARDFQPVPDVRAISTADFNAPAPRPRNSVLDCSLARQVGLVPADWRAALPKLISTLASEHAASIGNAA